MTFRPMLWPTLFALPALAILIVLGNRQMDRLAWKEGLLSQSEQGMSADHAPLPVLDSWKGLDQEVLRYTTARVIGTFDHRNAAHIYIASIDGQPGYNRRPRLLDRVTELRRAHAASGGAGPVLRRIWRRGNGPPFLAPPFFEATHRLAGQHGALA